MYFLPNIHSTTIRIKHSYLSLLGPTRTKSQWVSDTDPGPLDRFLTTTNYTRTLPWHGMFIDHLFFSFFSAWMKVRDQWSPRTGSWLQMNRLTLRNNQLVLKTAGKLPTILEEFIQLYPNLIKENRRMSTLGYRPVMPEHLPGHCLGWYFQTHN